MRTVAAVLQVGVGVVRPELVAVQVGWVERACEVVGVCEVKSAGERPHAGVEGWIGKNGFPEEAKGGLLRDEGDDRWVWVVELVVRGVSICELVELGCLERCENGGEAGVPNRCCTLDDQSAEGEEEVDRISGASTMTTQSPYAIGSELIELAQCRAKMRSLMSMTARG